MINLKYVGEISAAYKRIQAGLVGKIGYNHSSKDLPCHSSTIVFTWRYSLSMLYPLGNSSIESSSVNQGWCNASSARIRKLGGYRRNCCRRCKTEFFCTLVEGALIEVVVEPSTEDGGRLGRRGERGTGGTVVNTTLLAPGSSLNSYGKTIQRYAVSRKMKKKKVSLTGQLSAVGVPNILKMLHAKPISPLSPLNRLSLIHCAPG